MNGTRALSKVSQKVFLPSFCPLRIQQEAGSLQSGRGHAQHGKFVQVLSLDFSVSKNVRNKCLLLKPPSLCYSVKVSCTRTQSFIRLCLLQPFFVHFDESIFILLNVPLREQVFFNVNKVHLIDLYSWRGYYLIWQFQLQRTNPHTFNMMRTWKGEIKNIGWDLNVARNLP